MQQFKVTPPIDWLESIFDLKERMEAINLKFYSGLTDGDADTLNNNYDNMAEELNSLFDEQYTGNRLYLAT